MGNPDKRAKRAREKAAAARRPAPTPIEIAKAKAARRKCGDCQACCTALTIHAITKPAQTRCPNQCAAGCAIYKERPSECSTYLCMWRQGWGEEDDRPDKLGAVLDVAANRGLREVGGGIPGRAPVRMSMVDHAHVVPARVRMAMDSFLRVGEVVILSYPDRQTVFGPTFPNGISFSMDTLNEIDARIGANLGGEDAVRVRIIPMNDGFARVEFT